MEGGGFPPGLVWKVTGPNGKATAIVLLSEDVRHLSKCLLNLHTDPES